jgi:hypothetical protein
LLEPKAKNKPNNYFLVLKTTKKNLISEMKRYWNCLDMHKLDLGWGKTIPTILKRRPYHTDRENLQTPAPPNGSLEILGIRKKI